MSAGQQQQAFAYQNRLRELTRGGMTFLEAQRTARQETGYAGALPDAWGTQTVEASVKQQQAFAYQNRLRELVLQGPMRFIEAQILAKRETGYVYVFPDPYGTDTVEATIKQQQAFAYNNRVRELMQGGMTLVQAQLFARQETGYVG